MTPAAEFAMSHGAAVAVPTASPGSNMTTHSAWQSPVPYLFGGLAAMLGLIAFALLILACSYWKLSGYLDGGDQAGTDGRAGAGDGDSEKASAAGAAKPAVEFREHVVVIMAGDEKPSFLAMPVCSRAVTEPGPEPVVSCSGGSEDGKKMEEECEVSSHYSQEEDVQNRSDERAALDEESQ